MSMPNWEDMDASLEQTSMSACGETIQYRSAFGAFAATKAVVDYGDQELDTGTGIAFAQDISIEVLKAHVPEKPNGQCRVVLNKLPADTFKPVNVVTDKSGNCWVFSVEKVFG